MDVGLIMIPFSWRNIVFVVALPSSGLDVRLRLQAPSICKGSQAIGYIAEASGTIAEDFETLANSRIMANCRNKWLGYDLFPETDIGKSNDESCTILKGRPACPKILAHTPAALSEVVDS